MVDAMLNPAPELGENEYLPRSEATPDYMRDILAHYYHRKWNTNNDVLQTLKSWKNWPMMIRMPDIQQDFEVHVHEGPVEWVRIGAPKEPRILVIMLTETMQRLYYDETTAAIETIAGRIKIRGNETEKRRLLAAISFLTW